eukprot:516983-Rhodomonas_salina.4
MGKAGVGCLRGWGGGKTAGFVACIRICAALLGGGLASRQRAGHSLAIERRYQWARVEGRDERSCRVCKLNDLLSSLFFLFFFSTPLPLVRAQFYGMRYYIENFVARKWTKADVDAAEAFY